MSFLNFNKDKTTNEHSDTAEIKQAAISDTQLNSLNSSNKPLEEVKPVSESIPNKSQSSFNSDFVNPFSKLEAESNQSISNPVSKSSGQQSISNPNVSGNSNLNPLGTQGNIADLNRPSLQNNEPVGNNQSSSVSKTDLNKLNNDLTASIQNNNNLNKNDIKELIDETVEKIIEEKWDSMTEKIDRVLRWKEKKEQEINMLKEDIVSIGEGFSKLESKLISKISNYDKNILDVNSEIKALEKVFQKITPTLINNVNELSRIADDLKSVEPKGKKE